MELTTERADQVEPRAASGKKSARIHDGSLVEFECEDIEPRRAADIIQSAARKSKADQVVAPEPEITNAGNRNVADVARQKMMARDATNSAKPFWTQTKGSNMPNNEQKKDTDEAEQLKQDGLDPERPNADKARAAMLRKMNGDTAKKD